MKIYVVIYTHRHGLDVGAYKDQNIAYDEAAKRAEKRVKATWSRSYAKRFEELSTSADKLDFFNETELQEFASGEEIAVYERPVL